MSTDDAHVFDGWAKAGTGPQMEEAHEYAGKKVLDRIPFGYDEAFIDLGCGSGWATRYIAQKVPTIGLCVGVDVSPEFIKQARAAAAGKFPVKYIVAPLEDVPFGEASFNHAFSMEALYYVRDLKVALQSILRLLKVGGRVHLVLDYFKEHEASAGWQDTTPVKMHYLSEREWVDRLTAAGFGGARAERILDDRPVPPDMKMPWGGFKNREDLVAFRTKVGSLYLTGTKSAASHTLDPYLKRAEAAVEKEVVGQAPGKKERRRGRR